nr:aminotransferase class V-fold PLP-dependent enzyme [Myxococcota bacterium]
ALQRALDHAALVSIMHANNETGVLQPIAEISAIAARGGALVHTDAAQSIGKVRVDVRELGVDLLTIAGHKLYAPKGVGALFVRRGVAVEPLVLGAPHERGRRPGTENVVGIAGLGAAAALARSDLDHERARVSALRDRLIERLRASIPALIVHGDRAPRLPNTASVRFPRTSGPQLLAEASAIAASTGSACHAGQDSPSQVITAMGISPADALGTVRLSLGRGTTTADVDRAASCLVAAWRRIASA